MARLGASSSAHTVPPIGTAAHAPEQPTPAVLAPSLAPGVDVRASPPPATGARRCGPEALATTTRVADVAPPAPAAGRVAAALVVTPRAATPLPRLRGHRRRPLATPRAHAVRSAGEGARLRTVRRPRVPWPELGRERLAAAWSRVQAEHGAAGELLLVGVYGPVPLDAVTALALDADGRAAMTFARRAAAGRRGDVALARVASTGRLVRSDIPHPPGG